MDFFNKKNGELEVGQVIASIKEVPSVLEVMEELVRGYEQALKGLPPAL